eukprot:6551676-Alexandrium_andersonii.AAC.1
MCIRDSYCSAFTRPRHWPEGKDTRSRAASRATARPATCWCSRPSFPRTGPGPHRSPGMFAACPGTHAS